MTFLSYLIPLFLSRCKKKSSSDEVSVGNKEGVGNVSDRLTPNTVDDDVTSNLLQELPGQNYANSQSMGIQGFTGVECLPSRGGTWGIDPLADHGTLRCDVVSYTS